MPPDAPEPDNRPIDDALRDFVGHSLRRANNAVQARLTQLLKPLGLRNVTFSAMMIVVRHPGLQQSQLAEWLAVDRTNLVTIVDELERRKFLTRDKSSTDRRAYALHPTDSGRRCYEQAAAITRAHEAQVFAAFPPADIARLKDALRHIEDAALRAPAT